MGRVWGESYPKARLRWALYTMLNGLHTEECGEPVKLSRFDPLKKTSWVEEGTGF